MSDLGPQVLLGRRTLERESPPYVIAEIGVNHEGSLDQAKRLIELAAEGGADAAKFQSYTADTLASRDSPAYWDMTKEPTSSQHELFDKYSSFGEGEYVELAGHCSSVGIDFLCTPFDDWSVEFLEPLVPAYKVASADITNVPFLRRIASKGKPVVLSTGASTLAEIGLATDTLKQGGSSEIVLLHCILNYPTNNENAHLRMITGLLRAFPDQLVGYSDHTLPDKSMTVLVVAHLLGAVVIEKHFTHDKNLTGNDHYHAMDVDDLKRFTVLIDDIYQLLGSTDVKSPIATEEVSRRNARRSIVVSRPVRAGHVLTDEDLTYKRPGSGVSPIHWCDVVGRVAVKDLAVDDILQWEDMIPRDS